MATRVALVTGGSGGIGRDVALRLATDGFAVAVQYRGNPARSAVVVDSIVEAGGQAVAVQADVGIEDEVLALFAQTASTLGGVDVVVHTAGVMPLAPIVDTSVETFDRVSQANIRGTFLVAREAARQVRSGGSIVLFSTTITRLQTPPTVPTP